MKFNEVAVGDKFRFNGVVFKKIPEERISCCRVQYNCENFATKAKEKLNPSDEVEKFEP